MGYKMKGAPMHYGTKAHKSALKHIITDERKTEGHDRHNKRHANNPDYEHGKSTEKFPNRKSAPTKHSMYEPRTEDSAPVNKELAKKHNKLYGDGHGDEHVVPGKEKKPAPTKQKTAKTAGKTAGKTAAEVATMSAASKSMSKGIKKGAKKAVKDMIPFTGSVTTKAKKAKKK